MHTLKPDANKRASQKIKTLLKSVSFNKIVQMSTMLVWLFVYGWFLCFVFKYIQICQETWCTASMTYFLNLLFSFTYLVVFGTFLFNLHFYLSSTSSFYFRQSKFADYCKFDVDSQFVLHILRLQRLFSKRKIKSYCSLQWI